jgi:hypothetical protein
MRQELRSAHGVRDAGGGMVQMFEPRGKDIRTGEC